MQSQYQAALSTSLPSTGAGAETNSSVRIGAVHGIPSSHTEGLQKIDRSDYFEALHKACSEPIDILVTHSNPCIPRLHESTVKGPDSKKLYEMFNKSSARLHLHGHMHTEPVVAVLDNGKVVVSADCRVIAFLPS